MQTLETERLLLRPITKDDLEDVYAYSKTPQVGANAGWKPHENRAETEKILAEVFVGNDGIWGIVRKDNGRMIGSVGLVPDAKRENKHTRMLGYALAQSEWGKGYMTEAARTLLRHGFGTLGLTLVSAYCYPFNTRSRRVLQKLGLREEGCLREGEIRFDGEVLDLLCLSITAQEFTRHNRL